MPPKIKNKPGKADGTESLYAPDQIAVLKKGPDNALNHGPDEHFISHVVTQFVLSSSARASWAYLNKHHQEHGGPSAALYSTRSNKMWASKFKHAVTKGDFWPEASKETILVTTRTTLRGLRIEPRDFSVISPFTAANQPDVVFVHSLAPSVRFEGFDPLAGAGRHVVNMKHPYEMQGDVLSYLEVINCEPKSGQVKYILLSPAMNDEDYGSALNDKKYRFDHSQLNDKNGEPDPLADDCISLYQAGRLLDELPKDSLVVVIKLPGAIDPFTTRSVAGALKSYGVDAGSQLGVMTPCYRAGKNAQVIPGSLLYEPLEIVDTVRFADFATMDLCGTPAHQTVTDRIVLDTLVRESKLEALNTKDKVKLNKSFPKQQLFSGWTSEGGSEDENEL